MTTIAKFRRRRRISDSSSGSSNIDLSLNDSDDTSSLASYQSNSVATNASEQDSSRKPSTSASDDYDTDSEQQYSSNSGDNDTDDTDDGDNDDIDSIHFAAESSNMNTMDTALHEKLDAVESQESRTGIDTSISNPSSSATLKSQKKMDTSHRQTSKDRTYTSGGGNTDSHRDKKLWWGDGGNETGQNRRQSTSYSRKEATYPTNPGKDRHDGRWKSSFKNRRIDSNWRNVDGEQQTMTPRSDWRNQLSGTTEDKAASHWTIASIDQHLLESKIDELNWKKKQQQAKHDVEWPSLDTQQQQQQQQQRPPTPLTSVATERKTAPIADTERAPLSAPPPPTKTYVDPEPLSSHPQQNTQPSDNSSIPPPENTSNNAYTDQNPNPNQNTTQTVSRDESPTNDASDPGTSKSWSAVVKSPLQERNTSISHITSQMENANLWAESTLVSNESEGSAWGKWPQSLDGDTKPRKTVSIHLPHQQRIKMDINFGTSDESNGSSWGKWPQMLDDDSKPSETRSQIISAPHQPLSSFHLTQQQRIKMDKGFDGSNDSNIRVVLPPHHAPKTKHGYLDNKRALINSEQDISRQLKTEQHIQSKQDTTRKLHDEQHIQKKQDTSRQRQIEQCIQVEQDTAQQLQTEQRIHTEPSAIDNNDTTDQGTVDLQDQHQSPALASTPPSSPKLVSLSEYVRKGPIVRHAIDEAWWRAGDSEEIKESDLGLQQEQQEQQETQPYYYTPPWMMLSMNSNDIEKGATPQWMETADLRVEARDDLDYNRYQMPYTTPSGYHHPGSSSHSTPPPYFGNSQPNTLFY